MKRTRRGDPCSPAARSRCCRGWGCRCSTSPSSTWCSTGSCSPRRGTSCRGYSGYFSFGHGAFFGAGMYTTAVLAGALDWPFLWTLPVAALIAARAGRRAWRGRVSREARARRAVRACHPRVHVRRRHHRPQHADRRRPRHLAVAASRCPSSGRSPSASFYLLALIACGCHACSSRTLIARAKLGTGLFAIHDDEDVAEVMGVPDVPLQARRVRALLRARGRGRRHPRAVRVVRDGRRDVLHHGSALGGADERARRHAALGRPRRRRHGDHGLLYAFTTGDHALARQGGRSAPS